MTSLQDLVSRLSIGDDGELLVFSFDIGTTQSGAALAYTNGEATGFRAPAVLEKLPGQSTGKAKIPSVLLYDKAPLVIEEQSVTEEDYFSQYLTQQFPYPYTGPGKKGAVTIFESDAKTAPKWGNHPSIKELGRFHYFIPKDAPHEIVISPTGVRLIRYFFEVRVYYGETELRAAVYSNGEVLGRTAFLEGAIDSIYC